MNTARSKQESVIKAVCGLRIMIAVVLLCALSCAIVAFGGCAGSSTPVEKVYVGETEIDKALSDPDAYKGQYIILTGKVSNRVGSDGDTTTWQAYHDPQNFTDNFAFTVNNETSIEVDDYVSVDGKIVGSFQGANSIGGVVDNPLIEADSVQVMSYIDAVVPTQETTTPENAAIDQSGMTIRIDKIEFAAEETRFYVTATNNTGSGFYLPQYMSKVIQNGQQYEEDITSNSSYEGKYPTLSTDIVSGATTSGIIVFPPLDPKINLQFVIEGHSDDLNIGQYGILTYTFDIPGQTTDVKEA